MRGHIDRFQQLGGIHRLGDNTVHTGREALIMLLPGSMSGHRQDGRMRGPARGPFAFADQTRGLEPIQFRHLNVHENQIVAAFRKPLPDFLAIRRQRHRRTLAAEQPANDSLIDGAVLGHKDIQLRELRLRMGSRCPGGVPKRGRP